MRSGGHGVQQPYRLTSWDLDSAQPPQMNITVLRSTRRDGITNG
jgi:hypothetical protein